MTHANGLHYPPTLPLRRANNLEEEITTNGPNSLEGRQMALTPGGNQPEKLKKQLLWTQMVQELNSWKVPIPLDSAANQL